MGEEEKGVIVNRKSRFHDERGCTEGKVFLEGFNENRRKYL
jgi:hypothetical protein